MEPHHRVNTLPWFEDSVTTDTGETMFQGGRPILFFHGAVGGWGKHFRYDPEIRHLYLTDSYFAAQLHAQRDGEPGRVDAFLVRAVKIADLDNPPAKDIAYDTFEQALKNRGVDVEGLRDCYFSPTGSGDTCDFLDEPEVIEALVANGYDSAGFVEWDQYTYVIFSADQLWEVTLPTVHLP